MEILYHTSVKYISLWIVQFIKKWFSAHLWHGVSLPTLGNQGNDVILPSQRHSASITSHGSEALVVISALGTGNLFSSAEDSGVLLPTPRSPDGACVHPCKEGFCLHIFPKKPGGCGVFGLCWSLPASSWPSSRLPPRNYLAMRKISPGLNWDTINNSFSFNSLPVLTPSQLSSIPPSS